MSDQQTDRVRASDAERERVAAALRHAMGEGRLSLSEGEERLAEAYAATYRDELPKLTADLPPSEQTGDRAGRRAGAGTGASGSPRRRRPAVGVAAVAAVVAGILALALGGPLWPAIVLGIVAIMMAKRARYGYGHAWHAHPERCGRTAPAD